MSGITTNSQKIPILQTLLIFFFLTLVILVSGIGVLWIIGIHEANIPGSVLSIIELCVGSLFLSILPTTSVKKRLMLYSNFFSVFFVLGCLDKYELTFYQKIEVILILFSIITIVNFGITFAFLKNVNIQNHNSEIDLRTRIIDSIILTITAGFAWLLLPMIIIFSGIITQIFAYQNIDANIKSLFDFLIIALLSIGMVIAIIETIKTESKYILANKGRTSH